MNRKIPEFKSAEEERAYWAEADREKVRGSRTRRSPGTDRLKLAERSVRLRLPGAMMEELRVQANLMDVPQKSLIKTYLVERIEREMRKERDGEE